MVHIDFPQQRITDNLIEVIHEPRARHDRTELVFIAPQPRGEEPVHHIGFIGSAQIPESIREWEDELHERGYVLRKPSDT